MALALLVLLPVGVEASAFEDFSNNLASDLGPLLALFGDNMTKQYLSEMLSWTDYLIFGLAPVGIITAIVSVIRVCGSPPLKAFIGRAQEGDGTVEAELCTSTSRDVCELFNKGGITRVLGRPRILEIVWVSQADLRAQHMQQSTRNPAPVDPQQPASKDGKPEHADGIGIFLFRDYLRRASSNSGWELDGKATASIKSAKAKPDNLKALRASFFKEAIGGIRRRKTVRKPDIETQREEENPPVSTKPKSYHPGVFPPNPNLSLNVGIVKRSKRTFIAVAALGILLQGSVIAMAGVGSWHLMWTKEKKGKLGGDEDTVMDARHASIIYIVGSVSLATGMISCAALIGQSTKEFTYRRNSRNGPTKERIFWLQPGNQQVGDQTFDAFAYAEEKESPVTEYISSNKTYSEPTKGYVWLAVFATLIGFIAQFVGLRGMNVYVAIAQLGVTILMSFLRGILRMQRLTRSNNKLADSLDAVVGHELDWMAFELVKEEGEAKCKDGDDEAFTFWHTTGQSTPNMPEASRVESVDKLLRYRARLAYLTGHLPLDTSISLKYQDWQDEHVLVRMKARQLARAIEAAAETLFGPNDAQDGVKVWLQAAVSKTYRAFTAGTVEIGLIAPSDVHPTWRTDSAKLEGILGLWLWSMRRRMELQKNRAGKSYLDKAWNISTARIVSAFPASGGVTTKAEDVRRNLSIWLGESALRISNATLNLSGRAIYSPLILWRQTLADPTTLQPIALEEARNAEYAWRQFFGWNVVQASGLIPIMTPGSNAGNDSSVEILFIQSAAPVQASDALMSECAQDLYATILSSLASNQEAWDIIPAESLGRFRFKSEKVSALVGAFVETGLGSRTDAYLCIIPALKRQLSTSNVEVMPVVPSLLASATKHRRDGEWSRAETLLRWACLQYEPRDDDVTIPLSLQVSKRRHFLELLVALGELYRWAFSTRDPIRHRFAFKGIHRLFTRYQNSKTQATVDVVVRYRGVAFLFTKHHGIQNLGNNCLGFSLQPADIPSTEQLQGLPKVIELGLRIDALFLLSHLSSVDVQKPEFQLILLLACKNGWAEMASAILELDPPIVAIDARDENGRSAFSHCAEIGYLEIAKTLINHGASVDLLDNSKKTPLSWARENGHEDFVSYLHETQNLAPDSVDAERKRLHRLYFGQL